MSKIDEIMAQNKGAPVKPMTKGMERKMNGTQPKVEKNAKTK